MSAMIGLQSAEREQQMAAWLADHPNQDRMTAFFATQAAARAVELSGEIQCELERTFAGVNRGAEFRVVVFERCAQTSRMCALRHQSIDGSASLAWGAVDHVGRILLAKLLLWEIWGQEWTRDEYEPGPRDLWAAFAIEVVQHLPQMSWTLAAADLAAWAMRNLSGRELLERVSCSLGTD